MQVKIQKLNPKAKMIHRTTPGSSGWDLYYTGPHMPMRPGDIKLAPTGLAFELEKGTEAQIRSRSGKSMSGIIVLNSPGTIDSDYRGEIKVILFNASRDHIQISPGDRIAQVVFANVPEVYIITVDKLSTNTERGIKGFGSSG